jgi:hypothetical protein
MHGAVSHCLRPSTKISTRPTAAPFASFTLIAMRPVRGGMNRKKSPSITAATTPRMIHSIALPCAGRSSAVASMLRGGIEAPSAGRPEPPGRAGGTVAAAGPEPIMGGLEMDGDPGGGGIDRAAEPRP